MSTVPSPAPPAPTRQSILALSAADLIDRYAHGCDRFERRTLQLTDSQQDTAFRPEVGIGRWSCRILLGHIADAELVYTHRMRRAVAEESPVLAVWDENAFIDSGLYASATGGSNRPIAGSVALIHTVRLWTADWLRSLQPAGFERRALHPEAGPLTVHAILVTATWHLEHHAWFLSRKLEHLLGPAPTN
jgi:hypothetical protein